MNTALSILFVAGLCALGAGSALAHSTIAPKLVTVVMHDPGCHWFSVDGKLLTKLTVRTGSIP